MITFDMMSKYNSSWDYVKSLEYVYKCFPSKDCYDCPFSLVSLGHSRNTHKKMRTKGIHWHCTILDKWIIKRACTKELILKKLLEVI